MDSLSYSYSSESSSPRTPSPQEVAFNNSPAHYKPNIDIDPPRLNIFTDGLQDEATSVYTPDGTQWTAMSAGGAAPFGYNASRGSLLQELYEHDMAAAQQPPTPQDMYIDTGASNSPESLYSAGADSWRDPHHPSSQQQQQQPPPPQQQQRPHDYHLVRRATFPAVRKDYGETIQLHHPHQPPHHFGTPHTAYPQFNRGGGSAQQDSLYVDMPPLSADPSSMNGQYYHHDDLHHPHHHPHHSHHHSHHGHHGHHGHHQSIKLEDTQPVVPSQQNFYRSQGSVSCGTPVNGNSSGHPGLSLSYLSPHTGLPVQHTDDAASKETQYLRRRCHNCHTTEPPSWRRSTLNPGKIVCNKCGLYERTHLRPRPLRFDELRAGNKARKQNPKQGGVVSPKTASKMSPPASNGVQVKKEPREFGGGLVRRASVSSSSGSSAQSGVNSDWDDNVSLYSNGSNPTTYSSPSMSPFLVPALSSSSTSANTSASASTSSSRQHSHSPPLPMEIRLPGAPLSEIASLQQSSASATSSPQRSPTHEYMRTPQQQHAPSPQQQQQSPTAWTGPSAAAAPGKSSSPLQMQVHLEPSPQMQARQSPLMGAQITPPQMPAAIIAS